jgi:hypothetical protein
VGTTRDRLDELTFQTRNLLRWSAPAWQWSARSFDRLNTERWSKEGRARLAELRARHDLSAWPRLLSRPQLHDNLYMLDVLDRLVGAARAGKVTRGLDVGAKDGATLPARVVACPGTWDLVELDAHRRYLDLSTRRAHGERFARTFPGCRYLAGSVVTLPGPYDVITWFLPFVRLVALRRWGLPVRTFEPTRLLTHVVSLLAPGGTLLVVNQGDQERDAQARLFGQVRLEIASQRLYSPLSPFRRPRYLFRWDRP